MDLALGVASVVLLRRGVLNRGEDRNREAGQPANLASTNIDARCLGRPVTSR